jgi:hypothetical protein
MEDEVQGGQEAQGDGAVATSPVETESTSGAVFTQEQVVNWATLHAEAVSGKRIGPLQQKITELEGHVKAGQLAGMVAEEYRHKLEDLEDERDKASVTGENVPPTAQEAMQMRLDARRERRKLDSERNAFNLERLSFTTEIEDARRVKSELSVHNIASEMGIDAKTLSTFGPFASEDDIRVKAEALKQLGAGKPSNGSKTSNSFRPDSGGVGTGRVLTRKEADLRILEAAEERAYGVRRPPTK